MTAPSYETILVTRDGRVGTITLNRPKALNALNSQVMNEVVAAAAEFDNDPGIGAIIVTGSGEKAFAAGADIKEMAELTFADVFSSDFFAAWGKFAATRTPTIAAVTGNGRSSCFGSGRASSAVISFVRLAIGSLRCTSCPQRTLPLALSTRIPAVTRTPGM